MFVKNFARNYENKIILGTSDTWWMSHLSQQTSKPAYDLVDCWILKVRSYLNIIAMNPIKLLVRMHKPRSSPKGPL